VPADVCDCNCDKGIPVGSTIIIKGENFWRIDRDDQNNAVVYIGLEKTEGKVDVDANELRVKLPNNLRVGEPLSVSVVSNGVVIPFSGVTFTIAPPYIETVIIRSGAGAAGGATVKGCGLQAFDTNPPLVGKALLYLSGVEAPKNTTTMDCPSTPEQLCYRFSGNNSAAVKLVLTLLSGQTISYEGPFDFQ
jgi:hypothetical protein